MSMRRFRFTDPLIAAGVGLAAFALYLRTLAPGLLWGDSAEFQLAAWFGGFAHPTGYPLYLMLGWLWAHLLPSGDPAWRLNLFSAAWGGVAVGLVYLAAARLFRARALAPSAPLPAGDGGARYLALGAAAVFAVTPTFWSQAVVAEVYTLHAAFVAAILLAALAWAERPGRARLYLLAGLVGLSLAHHRTSLLLLPGLAVWLAIGHRADFARLMSMRRARKPSAGGEASAAAPADGLVAAALLLAPLLLYAYIPLAAPHAPYFTVALGPGEALTLYEPTLRGFVAHISGSVFRSALGAARGPWLVELAARLAGEVTWPGVALGALGVARLAWRDRRALALTGLSFLAFVLFNALYAIGDIYVFYIPAYLIWVLWMATGAGVVGWALFDRAKRCPIWHHLFAMALLLALAGWLLAANFARTDRSADRAALADWEAVLAQPIPRDAVLVTNDRDEMVPQWYLRYVEGRRPDLTGLFPLIQPGPAWSDVAAVTEQALRTGRPVYLIKPMPGLEVKFALAPLSATAAEGIGSLVRVEGPAAGAALARDSAATFGDRIRLTGYQARPPAVCPGQAQEVTLEWSPLAALEHDYTTFVHLVNGESRVIGQSDHRPGGVYYPTGLWRPGDRLRDVHRFTVVDDPGPAPYTLEVGLYRLAPDLQHLGGPQRVGELAPCD